MHKSPDVEGTMIYKFQLLVYLGCLHPYRISNLLIIGYQYGLIMLLDDVVLWVHQHIEVGETTFLREGW